MFCKEFCCLGKNASLFWFSFFLAVLLTLLFIVFDPFPGTVKCGFVLERGDGFAPEDAKQVELRVYYKTKKDPVLSERLKFMHDEIVRHRTFAWGKRYSVKFPLGTTGIRFDVHLKKNGKIFSKRPKTTIYLNNSKVNAEQITFKEWSPPGDLSKFYSASLNFGDVSSSTFDFKFLPAVFLFFFITVLFFSVLLEGKARQVFIVCFAAIAIFPALKMDRLKIDSGENRKLTSFPDTFCVNGMSKYFKQVENAFNDHFLGRKSFIYLSNLLHFTFDQRGNKEVLLAPEKDWSFFRQTVDFYAQKKIDPARMKMLGDNLNRINLYARKNNKIFIFFIAPDKLRIYGGKAGCLNTDTLSRDNDIDRLADYLRKHYDFPVIYPRKILLEQKKKTKNDIYFRHDTHWTEEGAYYGFFVPVMDLLPEKFNRKNIVKGWQEKTVFGGDLANFLSSSLRLKPLPQTVSVPVFEGEAPKCTPLREKLTYVNPAGNGLKLFALRDSFSTAAIPFFARAFSVSTFAWRRDFREADREERCYHCRDS